MAQKISLTSTTLVGGAYTPHTGLNSTDWRFITVSGSIEIPFSGFSESPASSGNYEFWGFTIHNTYNYYDPYHTNTGREEVYAQIKISGSWITQSGFGILTIYADNDQPVPRVYTDSRVDKAGGTMTGYLTYVTDSTTGFDGGLSPTAYQVPASKWVTDHFVHGDGTVNDANLVHITGTETITGDKTLTGNTLVHITNKTSDGFVIMQDPDTPDPGIKIFEAKYYKPSGTVRGILDFKTSNVNSDGTANFNSARCKVTSAEYNTPLENSLISKHYGDRTYVIQSGGGLLFRTEAYVDSLFTTDYQLRNFASIGEAIAWIINPLLNPVLPDETEQWRILINQHPNSIGYVEDITLPSWIHLIGQGQAVIKGSLNMSVGSTGIRNKIQNIHFTAGFSSASNLINCELVNVVLDSGSNDIGLSTCILRNSGFYAGGSVTSGGDNMVIGCFGSYNVAWNSSTDRVYSYNYISGDTYSV